MPKSENQKQKLLWLKTFFERETDENHPASMADILAFLAAKDISAERKSIYSDIQTLQDFGMDIVLQKGKTGGYYLASREFELPELKLLVDAVQSSKFLTDKKSLALIQKLEGLSSRHEGSQLRRQVVVSGRVKTMNESIYYNVDRIHDAIAENSQITFRYYDWEMDGTRKYREKDYVASPYGLCQDNENCYLLAYSQRYGITSYRVDRMEGICLLPDARIPCPELTGKAFTDYANKMFQMFAGDAKDVKLRFHKTLLNVVIDRFGRDTMLIPDGDEHFNFTVKVAVSPMFLSWVIGFGDKAQILYPQSVIDACRQLCRQATIHY